MTRTLRQFALAFVVAFSTAGVFTFAQGLNEGTIAGPIKEIEVPDGCPAGYTAEQTKPGQPPDANGDGIICRDFKGGVVIDNDDVPAPGTGARHVSGHGNIEPAKPFMQDVSFSFHGIGIDVLDKFGKPGNHAKGQFEFHDQTPAGADVTVHGDVICLSVSGNMATLVGVVTRSNDAVLDPDTMVVWRAEDNGEGHAAPADTMSRPSPAGKNAPVDCKFKIKFDFEDVLDIAGGNIQVHEDETSGDVPTKIEEKDPTEVVKESYGVNGQGNFFDAGKKVVQDIAFSFKAVGEGEYGKFVDEVAKGEFEYQDQTAGGSNLKVYGQMLCASVTGKSATLIGVVTGSNDKGLPVDTLVTWAAEKGDELDGSQDKVSRLAPIGVKLTKGGLCGGKVPAMKLQPLQNGTIYVK